MGFILDEVIKAAQREIEAHPFGKEATKVMAKEYIPHLISRQNRVI